MKSEIKKPGILGRTSVGGASDTAWLARVVVLLAICLAYANSFGNGFHFDDFHTVIDNPAIRSLGNVPRFFTDATTFSVLPANRTYRPVVSTMLALDYALGQSSQNKGGYVPLWFHVSTFLVFLGLVALIDALYKLLMQKTEAGPANAWLALLGAAWFGLHPAMAETVNYVIQRGDIYCTLGCVGGLYVFARYPGRRRWGGYLLPFAFAMLSKPPAAVFPILLGMYVWFFEGRQWKSVAAGVWPSAVVTTGLLWLQSAMTPKSFMPSILSPWDYRLTQPFVWARYAAAMLLPLHLNVDTDLGVFDQVNGEMLLGFVFVATLAAGIWFAARRKRGGPIAFGLLWFVVTQLPTSLYPLSEVENDHRMFFSFVGLMLAAVWGSWLVWERTVSAAMRLKLRPVVACVAVLVLAGYGYGVYRRNMVWLNEETLWLDDVQKSPKNGRGLMDYALTQMNKGSYAVALDYFTRALAYTPNYPSLEINLGVVNGAMTDQGDTARAAEAERHFLRAISLAPNDDQPHAFYGRWLDQHGRYAEAIEQLKTSVALDPPRSMQHDVLMAAYAHANDMAAARQAALETLAIAPDDVTAQQMVMRTAGLAKGVAPAGVQPPVQDAAYWINVSLAQYQQGKYQESIDSARRALAVDAKSAEAYNNIGAAYASMSKWDDAIKNDQEAVRLKPDFQLAKNNFAWAISQKQSRAR